MSSLDSVIFEQVDAVILGEKLGRVSNKTVSCLESIAIALKNSSNAITLSLVDIKVLVNGLPQGVGPVSISYKDFLPG